MTQNISPKERYHRSFVLLITIGYTVAFLAMMSGFFEAILLAAVFSSIIYPLYVWLHQKLGGRDTLASVLTLVIVLFALVVPLVTLLGLIADQAVNVSRDVKPWVEQQLSQSGQEEYELPSWLPLKEQLEPHRDNIMAKLGELTGQVGGILAGGLARLSQGTFEFFFQLFIMLYAMFYFLVSGPTLMNQILSYVPLSQADKDKMLEVGLSVSRATVKGTLIIGIIQGALGGLGFAVAGINAAVFWGAVMAVLSVLPGIGATLVWAPAVVYLLVNGHSIAAFGLLIWSAGVVGTIDNVLRPILVGRDTKMPDLLVLLSTLGGLGLFGASGLVLGPILAALFMTVLAVYSQVFADWLNLDQTAGNRPADEVSPSENPAEQGGAIA
ncbi:putative inner membrane protein [Planctomycetes bacterium CA13]|uniref:Putative inner membrane protein n=1 Tax=Novipirellula herctigrandis TaxID=2527986 RepID=A0A5C5Z2X5_9BACT|nr:putative inner membrane protein [Planctomycetes bacterium CA13]